MAFDKQKQLDLFDQYRLNPLVKLRNQIAIANQGLVRDVAHRLLKQLNNVDFDDLFQVGFMGLIRSIERYDPLSNHSFSSYAVPCIRGDMLHYLRDKHNTVRAGREISDFAVSIRKIVEKLTLELDRNPTDLEIAKGLEISLDRWLKIRQGLYECDNISFNVKVGTLGDERSELTDLTADRPQYYRTQLDELLTDIDGSIEQLYGNERRSIECYYLDNMSRKDTAKQIGVSPMTVSRCLIRGVRKLKALLEV